jgi:hypothetical protein
MTVLIGFKNVSILTAGRALTSEKRVLPQGGAHPGGTTVAQTSRLLT